MKKLTSILAMVALFTMGLAFSSCQGLIDAIAGDHSDNQSQTQPTTPTIKEFDPTTTPLTFEAAVANTSVTFKLTGTLDFTTVEYSLDEGTTWKKLSSGSQAITLVNAGDKVMFRGTNDTYNGDGKFVVTTAAAGTRALTRAADQKLAYVYGNIMSLLKGSDFSNLKELTAANEGAFKNLFENCPIDAVSENGNSLVLPAETLAESCYDNMFAGCTEMTTPPELPAETLAEGCYNGMFKGCSSITEAPTLPAPTLVKDCYSNMFADCSNLTSVTILATETEDGTLPEECVANWLSGAGTESEEAPVISVSSSEDNQINASTLIAASGDAGTTWTVQDESGEVQVTVSISHAAMELTLGEEFTLLASLSPEGTEGDISWETTDESIAKVDENGKVTAVGVGEARIVAQYGEGDDAIIATCIVTVKEIVKGTPRITISQETLRIHEGSEFTLQYELDEAGNKGQIRWESTDVYRAPVDQNGKVTALYNPGEAIVAVLFIYDDGKSTIGADCKVTVLPFVTIELSQTSLEMNVGDEVELKYTLDPVDASEKGKVHFTVSNGNCVEVNENGVIKAKWPGECDVNVSYVGDDDFHIGATCKVKVNGTVPSIYSPNKFENGGNPLAN